MQNFYRIYKLLNKRGKFDLIILLIMVILMSFFEVIGLGSVMPFIGVLSNPDLIEDNQILNNLYIYFNFQSVASFTLFLGIAFVSLYIFGLIF